MSAESPLERFKLALTGAARAIAHDPETEVAWTTEAPTLAGKAMRVPMPPREVPLAQATEARGFADSFALRMRHHDARLHGKAAPTDADARACYDAIEQVRYEAIGETEYTGMRGNLDAAAQQRAAVDPIARAQTADEVPLATAVSLMLREELTGLAVPKAARAGVEQVREFVESRSGDDFAQLAGLLHDQAAFQRLSIDLLRHLELMPTEPLDAEPEEGEDGPDEGTDDSETEDGGDDQSDQPEVRAEGTEGARAADSDVDLLRPDHEQRRERGGRGDDELEVRVERERVG